MPANWNDYRYFLAVARSGKLSVAGRQLGVDHATVARRIKSLEASCGSVLFDRAPSGYSLTTTGLELVPFAEELERGALRAENAFVERNESLSGKVRIGVPDGVAAYVISKAVQELCETYPYLEIQLVAQPRKFSLAKREVDFVIGVSRPKKGRIKVQKISDYTLHLYGHQNYLKKSPQITNVTDLKKLRGIGYISELIFDQELDYIPLVDPGFIPHFSSTSVHVQTHAILNGAGVGIMHDFIAEKYKKLVRILPEDISFTRTFWYIVHEDYADLERIRVVSSTLIEAMRKELKKYI